MKITLAGQIAQSWAQKCARTMPGLMGVYLSGSFLSAPEEGDWPESSDVDVVLVFEDGACPPKLGKFLEEGLLLEASCLEEGALSDLSHVLSTHYLAYALNGGKILYDPQGKLARLHRAVKTEYPRPQWVRARCEGFYRRMEQGAGGFAPDTPLPQMVNAWAFTTGISCFPILLAGLENCTVRKRYPAARRVLEAYGMGDFYPELLSLLAPEPLGRQRLSCHMEELEKTFALACESDGPSADYAFRGDISREGAAVALSGSWELIEGPCPEDAVFWMLATFARCHTILDMDGDKGEARLSALWAFLNDLGVYKEEDFSARLRGVGAFLPRLREVQEEILRKRA